MLSILIPVYNFDVRKLVNELHSQTIKTSVPFEILIVDDYSDTVFRQQNRELALLSHVIYEELPQNIGRSKIRNVLFVKAQYHYCLVIDCDAKIPSATFVSEYLKYCRENIVVCGGTKYETAGSHNSNSLRLRYGLQRESKSIEERNKNPYHSFSTFNFLISKNIVKSIRFDETITGYGHEDTLFGLALKKQNIEIIHIKNPLIHLGIESNQVFLDKALLGVKNLKEIMQNHRNPSELFQDITLLAYYKNIYNWGLQPFFKFLYSVSHKSIEKKLIREGKSLFYFDFLRLSYLCFIS